MSALAGDPIKVGPLPSLSGIMAISEMALNETAPTTIVEIIKSGRVLGKQLVLEALDLATHRPQEKERGFPPGDHGERSCHQRQPRRLHRRPHAADQRDVITH